MAEIQKKYLDMDGLKKYDAKLKAAVDAKDAKTLQDAKAYSDSLGANYDPAGSATTAKTEAIQAAKGYTDGEVTKVNATVAEVKKTADKGVTDAAGAKSAADKAQAEVDALETLVGTLPEDAGVATVVAYVDKKTEGMASDALLKELQSTVGQHTTDITGLKEKDTALQGAVDKAQGDATANKAAIAVLNGSGAGSVKKQVDDAINKFATDVSNDETVNTFKELVDYCATHGSEAAEMAGNIEKNKNAIAKLETFIGKLPEDTQAADVITYINQKIAAEKARAEGAEAGLKSSIDALKTQVGETSVADQIAAAKAAAIAQAASDATTKANKALADAKAFTTSEVGKTNANVTSLTGRVEAVEGKAHTHANQTVLDSIDAAAVNKWNAAEQNAKAYTDQKIGEFQPISNDEIDSLFALA